MSYDKERNEELLRQVGDAKLRYEAARTGGAAPEVLEHIEGEILQLELDRILVMPIDEVRALNRKDGITQEHVDEAVKKISALISARGRTSE